MRNSSGRLARKVASTGALVALIAASVAFTGPTAGAVAGPKWTVVKSPSPAGPARGELSSVSCASPTSCFAVGLGSSGMMVERWNGSGWSFVKAPTPANVLDAELNAVSCSSATNCFAVGDTIKRKGNSFVAGALAERWNGSKWSVVPMPAPAGAGDISLSAISCASAKSCLAVGDVSTGSFTGGDIFAELDFKTFTERWNGKTWSIVPSPNPKGSEVSLLSGVSCVTAKNCWAVGDYFGRFDGGSLIEHWNGKSWKVVPSPNPGGASVPQIKKRIKPGIVTSFEVSGGLSGVSCSTAKSCFAVGGGVSGDALVERWNGSKWSVVPSPAPPDADGSELAAVSCATPTDCSAVGVSFNETFEEDGPIFVDDFEKPLTEHWNGTAWSVVPQPVGAPFSELTSVSCPKTNNCAAVGDSSFAERWNGTQWKVAPFIGKTSQSQLIAVSCPTTGGCVAVGTYSDGTTTKTLAVHHVGSHWRIMPSPNPAGAVTSQLSGVACVSATDCTAVGTTLTIPTQPSSTLALAQPLIEHWNGSAWSIVPNPATGALSSQLGNVSCPSATNCTAVGLSSTPNGDAVPLIERWNGSTWSIVPSPAPAFGFLTFLSSVSCPSASNCTAVGYYEAGTGDRQLVARTLVEHWNGTAWSVVSSPNLKAFDFNALISVSCPSGSNCSAVGISQSTSGGGQQVLAEHWNGKKWVTVATPKPPAAFSAGLGSVSCRGTSSCYAAGYASTLRGDQTLIEHWNGKSWKVVPSPSPGTDGAGFNGISCVNRYTCTAVGSYGANNGFFTLIERGP